MNGFVGTVSFLDGCWRRLLWEERSDIVIGPGNGDNGDIVGQLTVGGWLQWRLLDGIALLDS